MENLDKEKYKEALYAVEDLNPSAYVLAKAEQKIRNPDVEVDDIINVIKNDAAITAEVIRISNSAFYGGSSQAKDLKSAVSKLGFQELLKLVNLTVCKTIMANSLNYYSISDKEFLYEGVITALIMEEFADRFSYDSQIGYTVGLLSVMGKTVINKILELNQYDGVYELGTDVRKWEHDVVGFDHAYAGAILLKSWEFPTDIVSLVLYQFTPEASETDKSLQYTLSFVRGLTSAIKNDLGCDEYELTDSMQNFMSENKLTAEDIKASLTKVSEKFESMKSELGVK